MTDILGRMLAQCIRSVGFALHRQHTEPPSQRNYRKRINVLRRGDNCDISSVYFSNKTGDKVINFSFHAITITIAKYTISRTVSVFISLSSWELGGKD